MSLDRKFEIVLTRGASAKMTIRENMRYWKEEEVIKIRSTREEEVLKEENEEEHEEGVGEGIAPLKDKGRRHAKLVRQSQVKESMSPRSIRCFHHYYCHFSIFFGVKLKLSLNPFKAKLPNLKTFFRSYLSIMILSFEEIQTSH